MIVKDEEHCIDRCLRSVAAYVDEIIIVDTGSTDGTKQLAQAYTSNMYDFPWNGSFADARNFAIGKARREWILILDADELMGESDLKRLGGMLAVTEYDAFFLRQLNYTNDATQRGWIPLQGGKAGEIGYRGCVPVPIIRVFRNNKGIHFDGVVHEVVDASVDPSRCQTLDIPIHHYWEEKDVMQKQMKYLAIAEKALGEKPNGRLHAIVAAVYHNYKHDYDIARRHYRKAAKMGYKKNSMFELEAECYLQLQDNPSAYKAYRSLTKSGYCSEVVCSNLANLMVQRGEYAPAMKLLNIALSNASDPADVERLQGYIQVTKRLMKKS